MNKKVLLHLLPVLALSCSIILCTSIHVSADEIASSDTVTQETYISNISKTIPIDASTLEEKISNGDTFVVLFGHKECKYCRKFSLTLKNFMNQTDIPVYYFDTTKVSSNDINESFLNVMNNVIDLQYTPTVVLLKHGKAIHEYIGSETTLEQLKTLTKYKY